MRLIGLENIGIFKGKRYRFYGRERSAREDEVIARVLLVIAIKVGEEERD